MSESEKILGTKITLDGEKLVKEVNGAEVVVEPEDKPFAGLPKGFKAKHLEAILSINAVIEYIKKNMPKREVPPTRSELIGNGVTKSVLKDLIGFQLVREYRLMLKDRSGAVGGERVVFCFSPQGKAYLKLYTEGMKSVIAGTEGSDIKRSSEDSQPVQPAI